MEWLQQQGPWCPALLEYLERNHQQYDVADLLHLSLRADGARPARSHPARSILVPTAHDEPAIQLEIYKEVFSLPAAIAYNTEVERQFLHDALLDPRRSPRRPSAAASTCRSAAVPARRRADRRGRPSRRRRRRRSTAAEDDEPPSFRPHLAHRGAMFRRRHRLHGPFALYGGRIDPGKGCEELIEYFSSYVKEGGDATLVLMGVKLMPLPEEPFIRFAGLLSDQERLQALEAATVVVVPVAVREPVAAGARSVRGRHAGARQRAQRGARRALPSAATPACTTPTATSSSSA